MMSAPQHPNVIIVQNQYYPKGLREIDIWNYYQKVKPNLIREVMGRELIIFFGIDTNKVTVIRKIKDSLIRITPSNYDTIISGRTLSIHSCMKRIEDFGIIDIDIDDFDKAKEVADKCYYTLLKCPFVEDVKIRFTGKESFHMVCYFKRSLYIDKARILLKDYLESSDLSRDFDIEHKRTKGVANLDLAPNKYRGGYITLDSLSVNGLKCMFIPINYLKNFRKENAVI